MKKYIIKRTIATVITIWAVITVTFFLMHMIPGGPFDLIGQDVPPETLEAMNERYHLNDPVPQQYIRYLVNAVQGDLGPSYRQSGVSVVSILKQGFPVSAKVGAVAVVIIVSFGVVLGIIAALFKGRFIEQFVTVFTTIGMSIPGFVMAASILYFFSERWALLPSNGISTWKHYIGPVVALSLFSIAFIVRLMASNLREVLQQDYIRTARANGIPEYKVIFKHAMRNAIIPVVTYLGPTVGSILTGSFVVEKVFTIPGMGKYFVDSINMRDYTVLMGVTLFYAVLIILILFLIDLVYVWIDPRIKLK